MIGLSSSSPMCERASPRRLVPLVLASALILLSTPCTAFTLSTRHVVQRRGGLTPQAFQVHSGNAPATTVLRRSAWPQPLLSSAASSSTRLWASLPDKKVRGGASSKGQPVVPAVQEDGVPHPYRDALIKTSLSILMAILFGAGVWATKGADSGIEYYAGYLVEQSLSVDNLFVFVVLFEYFKVPTEYQNRVLTWGIIGAMVMRAIMVAAGVEALEHFKGVLLFFAGVLIFSSLKLLTEGGEEESDEEDLSENGIIALARKMVSTVDYYDGSNFFTFKDGMRVATPLLLVLVCIELSDVVFAIDSVPAVFGVTKDPFIVYTSNIFAILGLRSLYTVLANAMMDLPYLKPAVALILGLVGTKLGAEYFGYEVSNVVSLTVITSILGIGVGTSLAARNKL